MVLVSEVAGGSLGGEAHGRPEARERGAGRLAAEAVQGPAALAALMLGGGGGREGRGDSGCWSAGAADPDGGRRWWRRGSGSGVRATMVAPWRSRRS